MATVPEVLWAQREDQLYLTVPYVAKDHTITIKGSKFAVAFTANDKKYELDVELFAEVEEEGTKWTQRGRSIDFIVKKKEPAWWDRLTKEAGKKRWVKTDWAKWKDEDDDEVAAFDDAGMQGLGGGGMPPGMMGGMPGMGGMGGAGGPGGFDMASMMAQMGAAGGGGGAGMPGMPGAPGGAGAGMDFSQFGGAANDQPGDADDDDDDGPPPLEDA